MERALALHAGYPENKPSLRGKQGRTYPWSTINKIPRLATHSRQLKKGQCVHCHQVLAGLRQTMLLQGEPLPEHLLWTYPLPDSVGFGVDREGGTRVTEVAADSPAAKADLRVGDMLETVAGQPVISLADIQWALQNTEGSTLAITVTRNESRESIELKLPSSWKRMNLSWRFSRLDLLPGFGLEDLSPDDRTKLGIKPGELALELRWLFANHPAGAAGFRKGDVLIEVDGKTQIDGLGALIVTLGTDYAKAFRARAELPVVVLRKGRRVKLRMPMVFGELE